MSTDLCLTNEKSKYYTNKQFNPSDIEYLNKRFSYLEKIIESKYSDILNLASEISNLQNINLKYDLVDVLIKHGSNLEKYKSELIDVKDMLSFSKRNSNNENNTTITNDIENTEPHNSDNVEKVVENVISNEKTVRVIENSVTELKEIEEKNQEEEKETCETTKEIIPSNGNEIVTKVGNKDEKTGKFFPIKGLKLKNFKKNEEKQENKDEKRDAIKQKIINNLNKLISYKENTFNDLIEIVGFSIDSSSEKVDLSVFIEALESQIVELNQYKNNILNGYSLSKSIELGSNGKITFSRIFIEKERLLAKDKETYETVLTNMYNLYSEFVDNYLKNINYMKPHLSDEKIKSMQSNCGKVIYDFKLIRALYASLNEKKGM